MSVFRAYSSVAVTVTVAVSDVRSFSISLTGIGAGYEAEP